MTFKKMIACFLFCLISSVFAEPVISFQLDNGLSVFVKPDHRAPVALLQVWYRVGSSYESNGVTGISHVLEHMMFQGTPHYPAGRFNEEIEQHGGMQNAMTTTDFTMYYEELPEKYLSLALSLEADRMVNLTLKEKYFQKEMGVVKTEKRLRYDNSPQGLTYQSFMATAHISNPYHHPVIGWENDLDHLKLSNVKNWYDLWYTPSNAILVIVGDVQPAVVKKQVEQYFGQLPAKKVPVLKPRAEQTLLGFRQANVKAPANVPFLILGYNTPVYSSLENKQDIYALMVLSYLLGGDASSRLTKSLVRQKMIAAGAESYYDPFMLHENVLAVFAVPAAGHATKELQQGILKQISRMKKTRVSEKELERIKTQIIASKIYEKDSIVTQATNIGGFEVIGLPYTTEEIFLDGLKQVTSTDVKRVANTYLQQNKMVVSVLTPEKIHQGKVQ